MSVKPPVRENTASLDMQLVAEEQQQLQQAARLHWFHWLVVGSSLLLTLVVWYYAKLQVEERIQNRFDRQVEQTVGLITERLSKYEDALWAGVAAIRSHGGEVSFDQWQTFASALELESKYRGINGIGFIHSVPRPKLTGYLTQQRNERPNFAIKPAHQGELLLPISYIIPVDSNIQAVGLDVAHEQNRLSAALKARDSGQATITAPIVLVQDAEKTPGFLFYAPLYRSDTAGSPEARQQAFEGLVYAPFVVKKLMLGTLERARRQLGVRIVDDGHVLYDENQPGQADFDPKPLLKKQVTLMLYGRPWSFDFWSSASFRADSTNNQPNLILIGGICIDIMLLSLFYFLSRSNLRAIRFADMASKGYQQQSADLERSVKRLEASNRELERVAYVASHDLQEPLRTLSNYVGLLQRELGDVDNQRVATPLRFIDSAAKRMRDLVQGLVGFGRNVDEQMQPVDFNSLLSAVTDDLTASIQEADAKITSTPLPTLVGYETELRTLLQNVLSNAIKFRSSEREPIIHVSATEKDLHWLFRVQDNGIGIEPQYQQQVFMIFKRLHNQSKFTGSGIGLANCKKAVDLHGGEIWVESNQQHGCSLLFLLPKKPNH